MERTEYRKRKAEKTTRVTAGGIGAIGALDATGPYYLDPVQQAIIDLPWHGGISVAALAGGAIISTYVTRHRRSTDGYRRRQVLRDSAWAGWKTRRQHIGLYAARHQARISRPDMTRTERMRARASEVGIPVGSTVSGPSTARGKPIVLPFELGGALVLGEPGSRKSTLLGGIVTRLPGASVVVSTKTEFVHKTGRARTGHHGAPVYAFNPLSLAELPEHVPAFRWSLVRGCADPRIAGRRARALMEATAAAGLAGGQFWQGKGRAALTALLCAADLANVGLRHLASWLQRDEYSEPAAILERNSDRVERSMIETLTKLGTPGDKTASSISHTASDVLEFLSDGLIADALDPTPGTEVDLEELIRHDGTLYMVTDSSPALAPVISAIWDSLVTAAKTVADEHPSKRLPRPLALIADEIDKTLPAVPIDQHAAELRGWGVFILAATQNRNRLYSVWGRENANALLSSLQTHVVLSLNSQDDREYYQRRVGTRKVHYVKTSESAPDSRKHRMFGTVSREGHSSSTTPDEQHEPLWSAESWSQLDAGLALVIPTKGASAVVDTGNGWATAAAMDAAIQNAQERAAFREELRQRATEKAAAAEREQEGARE